MSRTPSLQAHESVLKAVLDLIANRGMEELSVDEIADTSGVSKATIYKHWTSKEDICLEAIGRLKCDLPAFDSGHPRADLTSLLRHMTVSRSPEAFSKIWPRVLSYAESHPAFRDAFHKRISSGRRGQLESLLQRAADRGELRSDLDVDLAMDLLFGPIIYGRLMQSKMPANLPDVIVDSFWRLNSPGNKAPGKKQNNRKTRSKQHRTHKTLLKSRRSS